MTQVRSYVHSPLFLHDYATGVVASAASALEHLGQVRGLPSQSIRLDRRLVGLHYNDWLSSYLNGQHLVFDSWGVGPDNGIYETKDGKWFSYVGDLARLKKEFSRYLDCPLIVESVRRAIKEKNAQEIEDDMIKLGLPGGWLRSRQEWLDHPVGAYAKDTPLIEFEKRGNSHSRKLGQSKSRLLSGVRVLDLTNVIANPIGGRLLAEAGADVININPVTGGYTYPTMSCEVLRLVRPSAEIVFAGPRKNYELFEADPRIAHREVAYARGGSLRDRLQASADLWFDDGAGSAVRRCACAGRAPEGSGDLVHGLRLCRSPGARPGDGAG